MHTLRTFCFVLIALFGALQVVSGGLISEQVYQADFINHPSNYFCNGSLLYQAGNFVAGECYNGYNNLSSNAYYCDDGLAVIMIQFAGTDCHSDNVTNMERIPTTCGVGSVYAKWQCQGTDPLPNGWSFPPVGQWGTETVQYNNTWDGTAYGASVPTCGDLPPSAYPVTIEAAYYAGCQNSAGMSFQTPRRSTQSFRGGFYALYNDYDCNEENLQTLSQGFDQGCQHGVYNNGIQSGPDAPSAPFNDPSNLVFASRSYYAADENGNYCGTLLSNTYFAATCFDSQTVVCVDDVVYTESDYVAQSGGTCNGLNAPGYPRVQNITEGSCVQAGNSDFGFSYSCSSGNARNAKKHKRSIKH